MILIEPTVKYCQQVEAYRKEFIECGMYEKARFLFGIGYRKLIAGCDADNVGSARVLEKIGMKQEGRLRKQILRKDGSWGDDLQFGMFFDEL